MIDQTATEPKLRTWGKPCPKCGINKPRKYAWNYCQDCAPKPKSEAEIAAEKLRVKKMVEVTPEQAKQIAVIDLSDDRSDLGNAARFEHRHGGEFLWTKATGWLTYDNGLWVEDKTAKVDQAMVDTVDKIAEEAALVEEKAEKARILKFAEKSRANGKINAALERASKLKSVARNYDDFDNHEELFHCSNGELNLETMEFGPHDPELLLTKGSTVKYDPAAVCPGFERYISEVMGGNQNLIDYVRRACGYSLTASMGEDDIFFLTGNGGGGKTTLLNIMLGVLGSYAFKAQRGMFMLKRSEGQPFDYHGLGGCRVLISSETVQRGTADLEKLKEISGGEASVKACKKFCDSYDFTPRCKVWMACNSALEAPGLSEDDAYWQRQKTIPFDVKFRDVEGVEIKDLDQKLLAEESSGILNYFLRGLAEYREIGMAEPEETKAKTEELRDDADFVGRFLEDRTEKTENSHEMVEQSALYATYSETAEKTREGRMSKQKFGKALEARGHKRTSVKVNGKTRRVWDKLKLVYAAYQPSTGAFMKDETF